MGLMLMARADQNTEPDVTPNEQLLAAIEKFMEDMTEAGVLVQAVGLQPSSKGSRPAR